MPHQLPANDSEYPSDLCRQMELFTIKLAHDLRGSLQLITAYADLLATGARGSLEPEQLKPLNSIQAGTKGIREKIERGQAHFQELIQRRLK
jgi:hypothetical protein